MDTLNRKKNTPIFEPKKRTTGLQWLVQTFHYFEVLLQHVLSGRGVVRMCVIGGFLPTLYMRITLYACMCTC